MSMPGVSELVVIFVGIVFLFGGKKLPALGTAVGECVRNFKKGIADPPKGDVAAKNTLENQSRSDG